jgi:choline dehydrogenase-like flavoprotein
MSDRAYDYVIVGAGAAGCVLAGRLTQDPDTTVCLIEAGPAYDRPNTAAPLAGGNMYRTRYDWDYDTHPEPYCNGRRMYLPRGRMLGGSTTMNGQVYVRGNPLDYDDWKQPGWSFEELLPYFIRSEDNERGADRYHGAGGPWSISDNRSRNPMCEAFVAAAVEAGFPANPDFNGASQDGFGWYQVTQRNGRRCGASVAFLQPALGRPNLTVETNFQAHRVLIEGGRARAVVGHRLDEVRIIRAEREVIVSAGTYNSPQLLMLSGVGDAESLSARGIPVVADLPDVGRNLQDHVMANLVFTTSRPVSLLAAGQPEYVRQFEQTASGPLTSNYPESGGFVRTDAGLSVPDVQFHAIPLVLIDGGLGAANEHGMTFGPCVLAPQSRGAVEIVDDEPTAKPRILHNYLSDPADLRTLVAGLRVAKEIARQNALEPYTEAAYNPPESDSDADMADYVRDVATTLFHPAGTCAMGTVVDDQLRVYGVQGLRVADASVMPSIVRGNTHAAVTVIGEKAADLIRNAA